MKRIFIGLLLWTLSAWAGGPTCAPGYCLDFDGNGCHWCGVTASKKKAKRTDVKEIRPLVQLYCSR